MPIVILPLNIHLSNHIQESVFVCVGLLCLSVGLGEGVSENVCHLWEYRGGNLFGGHPYVCVWEEEQGVFLSA
jgi:hypothetical protein